MVLKRISSALILQSVLYSIHSADAFSRSVKSIIPSNRNANHIRSNVLKPMQSSANDFFKDEAVGNEGPSLIPMTQTAKSQLASAFTALDESDQYDAVLTGLCAKILDSGGDLSHQTTALHDPKSLLQEMNDRKIHASSRSLMALIDATVRAQDAETMGSVLSLSTRNPTGVTQFGVLQQSVLSFPPNPSSKVVCPDGKSRSRDERLLAVADIPLDDRAAEISNALTVSGIFATCTLINMLGMDDLSGITNLILFGLTTVGVVDNFYDVLKFGTGFVMDQVVKNSTDTQKMKLPEKDSLPFGLGTGQFTGKTVRGLTRLLTTDTERECECEAAALYAAYTLGLPCFAFRPNALEAAYLVAASSSSGKDSLLSSSGILKTLIWVLAPVAMESMKHPLLIASDPREASGFLQRLEDNEGKSNIDRDSLWWMDDEKERQDLLKWAYTEADLLLRNNIDDVLEVTKRLSGGAATIGDCVAVIERW